jgi:hypothetical protein
MKSLVLVLSLVAPLSSFAALRADCVGKLNGNTFELSLMANKADTLNLKSGDLSIGNMTFLKAEDLSGESRTYTGRLDCNNRDARGAVTEMFCGDNTLEATIPTEIAEIATAEALPLGDSFTLELVMNTQNAGKIKIGFACETTMILSRTL